jgi:hypothetical protein
MLVCSIHDPAIFDTKLFQENSLYEGRIDAHLDRVGLSHLLVCDDAASGSLIWSDIFKAAEASPFLAMKLSACLNPQRIVYLPCEKSRYDKLVKRLDRPGSASVVGLICHGNVDVLIAAQDTVKAMVEEGMDLKRTCTMADYHKSPVYARERLSFGGRPVSDLSREQFLQEIVVPVIHWAKHAAVVDKVITRAAFGGKEGMGKPNANWPRFRATVRDIYAAWQKTPFANEGEFEIVSSHNNFKVGDELAAALAERLGLMEPNVVVSLKSDQKVGAINHDRYLWTDKDVCIGFTKGFDLLSSDEPCGVSDVYLRQPQAEKDTVTELIHAESKGSWSGR